jgi:hypothetical protein
MNLIQNLTVIIDKANNVAENYAYAVSDLRGEFARIIGLMNPAAASVRRAFINAGIKLCDKRLNQYRLDLEASTEEVMRHAMVAAGVDPDEFLKRSGKSLVEYIKELNYSTVFGVSGLAQRDVKYGSDQLKVISFNVLQNMANAGLQNAVKGAVVKNIVANANYVGKNGKPWRSITSSFLATKHHLITVFNETTIYVGLETGRTDFVIRSIGSAMGMADSVIDVEGYRSIRDEVFHPNARSLIYIANK